MLIPIDPEQFEEFIVLNNLFEKTLHFMKSYLKNWFKEDETRFVDELGADFDHVMNTYIFKNGGVSFSKDFSHGDLPVDYISVWIRIMDQEDCYLCTYTAFYDYDLNCFDDKVTL